MNSCFILSSLMTLRTMIKDNGKLYKKPYGTREQENFAIFVNPKPKREFKRALVQSPVRVRV